MSEPEATSGESTAGDGTDSDPGPISRPGVVGYVREGLQIARWDAEAVERISRDSRALFYGAIFMVLATLLGAMPELVVGAPEDATWPFLLIGLLVVAAGQLVLSALAVALIHGAARLLFGASGRYLQLLRVLWIGSIVLWLGVIPYLGALVGGVAYLLVMLVAISEVEGVERLQALVLVVGLRALIFLAGLLLVA